MATRTRASKKDHITTRLFVFSLMALWILSRTCRDNSDEGRSGQVRLGLTCMYSCSCLTPVRAVLSSLIMSSNLLWLGSSSPSLVASLGASPEHKYHQSGESVRGQPALTYIHAEHHNLRGHGGHLVGEAILVNSVHMSSEGVFSVGFSLPLIILVNRVHI